MMLKTTNTHIWLNNQLTLRIWSALTQTIMWNFHNFWWVHWPKVKYFHLIKRPFLGVFTHFEKLNKRPLNHQFTQLDCKISCLFYFFLWFSSFNQPSKFNFSPIIKCKQGFFSVHVVSVCVLGCCCCKECNVRTDVKPVWCCCSVLFLFILIVFSLSLSLFSIFLILFLRMGACILWP